VDRFVRLKVLSHVSRQLPISVAGFDSDDKVSVNVAGLPAFETISDALDNKSFGGSSVTLTAAEVNSGLTLHSTYSANGQPVNILKVTATNATAGESATSPAQNITVTDPPTTPANAQDQIGDRHDFAAPEGSDHSVDALTVAMTYSLDATPSTAYGANWSSGLPTGYSATETELAQKVALFTNYMASTFTPSALSGEGSLVADPTLARSALSTFLASPHT
jgi:hypothetical protein